MDLTTCLQNGPLRLAPPDARTFAVLWTTRFVGKGGVLARQGEASNDELILLNGRAVSVISDQDGRTACIGLHTAPGVIPPNLGRTRAGESLVSIEVQEDALVAAIPADTLTAEMLRNATVRDWGNAVMRDTLAQKADREWCLSALGGAERLEWFRDRYPGFETLFPHARIASFLGMTPVTFSRLRRSLRQGTKTTQRRRDSAK